MPIIAQPWLRHALVAFTLAAVTPVRADPPLFVWVDKQGNMHATDRLGDVPEPYHAMYEARLKEQQDKQGQAAPEPPQSEPAASAPASPAPPPLTIPTAADEAARRLSWRNLVAHWRAELAAATGALQQAEQELQEATMNPILRETPAVKERASGLEAKRDQARLRVMVARRMLLEDLPKRARVEHVPPLWLQ